MHIDHTIRSFYGRVQAVPPSRVIIPSSPADAIAFAARIDREADALLSEGRVWQAERLSHLALEARTPRCGWPGVTTPRQLNHAAIAHAIRDCELNAPHQVPLLQAALHGAIGLLALSRTCQARTDLLIGHPSIVLVPDDDHDSTGPDGWAGRADVARWAEHAIIHAAAGDVEHYRTAVLLALRVGRLVFVETDSAHAFAWHKVFADRNIPTLNILARGGVHPLPPRTREAALSPLTPHDVEPSIYVGALTYTVFYNEAAGRKTECVNTLPDLANAIRNTKARSKDALPWIKLARFGQLRTKRNSLRNNDNVIEITGVEADYDREIITFDEAVNAVTRAGVLSIVYTSPSHTEETRAGVSCARHPAPFHPISASGSWGGSTAFSAVNCRSSPSSYPNPTTTAESATIRPTRSRSWTATPSTPWTN